MLRSFGVLDYTAFLKEKTVKIDKKDIEKLEYAPSAMLDMTNILTKKEMRDLVAFLSTLKEAEAL